MKENERKEKAREKMERRQKKKGLSEEDDGAEDTEQDTDIL
jgi:hypothetical protein